MTSLICFPSLDVLWILILLSGYRVTGGVEYCWEEFNASCSHNEVILMQSAHYGRMRVARCLKVNFQLGCQSDVIHVMDRKCSGRRQCVVPIPDTEMQKETECRQDLVAYLDATYTCINVVRPKGDISAYCSSSDTVIETKTFGYISSLVSIETSAGSPSCPWVISAPKGQKVNVMLLNFDVRASRDPDMCAVYATVREVGGDTEITVCGGDEREKVMYLSDSNMVEIEINPALAQDKANMPYFLLKYEAIGCPDIAAPPGGWIERREYKLKMGCNDTQEMRHLVCDGDTWAGEIANCSGNHQTSTPDKQGFVRKDVPFGLVLAIVIGVILGIIIGSLLLGIVLYTQNKLKRRRREEPPGNAAVSEMEKTQILQSGNYGYAHVWELQQLRTGNECPNADQRATIRTAGVCPGEFGSHLGKPPGFHGSPKDHYESPRFSPAGGHIHTIAQGPRHTEASGTLLPKCHEFDVHIKTTLAGANNPQRQGEAGTEARYTD